MIIKLILSLPTREIPVNSQKQVNSYIHRCLGKDNKFHDAFSKYAITGILGGKIRHNKFVFDTNPWIQVSSEDSEFLNALMVGVQGGDEKIFDMEFVRFELSDFKVNQYFDTIYTVSPIMLKRDKIKITFEDEGWLDYLNEHCRKKLEHNGIIDNTFKIEVHKPERFKKKKIWVGDIFNMASQVSLIVRGKQQTRTKLYNLGIGCSTGSGFGSVHVYSE